MACSAEANGTTINCACDSCGISYNSQTKKYQVLCCGIWYELDMKFDFQDPDNPPRPGHLIVDIPSASLLEAMQFLDRADPGKLRLDASFTDLKKRVSLKGNAPVEELARKLLSGGAAKAE